LYGVKTWHPEFSHTLTNLVFDPEKLYDVFLKNYKQLNTNKPMLLYYNGNYVSNTELVIPISNRSFRYGDGLFETIVFFNHQIPFLPQHLTRLKKGMKFLKIIIPYHWNIAFFTRIIEQLALQNGAIENARIRLMVYRKGTGAYQPITNEAGLLIEIYSIDNKYFILNKKGLSIGIFHDIPKPNTYLSTLKHNNCLASILASIYKTEQGLDDCLLLNEKGTIAEGISSNVFVIRNQSLLTPSLYEGGVSGIMRGVLLQIAKQLNVPYTETSINTYDLLTADEIWLTNAIKGIRWVEKFNKKIFTNQFAQYFMTQLNKNLLVKNP